MTASTRRPLVAAGLAAGMLLAGACASHSEADYPSYASVDELWQAADLVVEVTLGPEPRVERIQVAFPLPGQTLPAGERVGDVYTVHAAEVTVVWKGAADVGHVVRVKQAGGEHGGTSYPAGDGSALEPGGAYLLFLETYDEVGVPASLVNPTQGQYPLDPAGQPQALDGNDVTIASADLAELAGTG